MPNEQALENMNAGGDTLLDLESVNSMSFDDMPEDPGFVNPPDGIYDISLVGAKMEEYQTKDTPEAKGGKKNRISHYYTIDQVVELVNGSEQKPEVGAKFSERFMLNESGLKFWKTRAKQILGDGSSGSNLTLANVLNELNTGGYKKRAKVKQKKSEGKGTNKGKMFTNIQVQIIGDIPEVSLEGGAIAGNELKV